MVFISASALSELPKAELHSHIDGSVPLGELFRIAHRHGRKVRTPKGSELDSVSALVSYVTRPGYSSLLDNIVERFFPITDIMQTKEVLRGVGRAYAESMKRENIMYAEGRFAPQYHTGEGLSMDEAITGMAEGLAEGCERFGVRIGLIVAIGRESTPEFGEEVAATAVRSHSAVGLDLGGPEAGNPPEKFAKAFKLATDAGLNITVHAGEGAGSVEQNLKNISSAITVLRAKRVGHAIDLAKEERLVNLVCDRSVGLEMNPVSNLTLGKIQSVKDLRINDLLGRSALVTLNSDDPALWQRGRLNDVFASVCRSYGFGLDKVDRLVENSISASFTTARVKSELLEEYGAARKRVA
ncbi:MAG: adenosine deaminase family protein [Nitrososphaerota archaeon]|nr:adenosine deaminase family protein [Nitrososphaerota archaeon]